MFRIQERSGLEIMLRSLKCRGFNKFGKKYGKGQLFLQQLRDVLVWILHIYMYSLSLSLSLRDGSIGWLVVLGAMTF